MLLPPPTSTLFPYTTLFRSRPIKKDSIPISANRVQPWPILYLPLQCPTNVRQPFLGGHIPMHGYAQPPLDVPLFLMYTVEGNIITRRIRDLQLIRNGFLHFIEELPTWNRFPNDKAF